MNNEESLQTIDDRKISNTISENKNKKEDVLSIKQIENNNNNNNVTEKEKENSNITYKKQVLVLSRNVRLFIFIILLLISIMINMDHGTIPAATSEIKKSLKQGDDVLGLFGSLVFFGNIIGTIFHFNQVHCFLLL